MDVSVVLVVYNQLALTRACLDSLRASAVPFELCVVDNASTDGTGSFFRNLAWPTPVRYRHNPENLGLIRALNQGALLATGEYVCFLHNDTEMREASWLERLRVAVGDGRRVGLAGLYGARRVRGDGRYAGRSIVHCLVDTANLRAPVVEVAAVDGVCLFLRRDMIGAVGGFDEGYGFFHGYDRDLSFAVREAGRQCVVANSPFVHHGGGTRTAADAPRRPEEDLAERRAALARFVRKWGHRLPCDVRRPGERLRDWLARPGGVA